MRLSSYLSSNLLVLPNLFILTFYLALSRFKKLLDKVERVLNQKNKVILLVAYGCTALICHMTLDSS
jgi:hypothetical protein